MRPVFKILLRIFVTALLLYLVLHKIDFQKIFHILKNANIKLLWAVLLCYVIVYCLCAMRWHWLLYEQGVKITYLRTLAYYLIGFFYNNFLPTVIGGGVVRAFYAGRNNKNRQAFSAMLVEIIIGGWALVFYTIVMCVLWKNSPLNRSIILSLFAVFIVASVALYLFFERRFMQKFRVLLEKIQMFNLGERLKSLYSAICFYKDKRFSIIKVVITSLLLQVVIGIINLLIGIALGFKLPVMSYMVYPAIIGLITTIPITMNGIGLREWGYKFFFSHLSGVTVEQAIILSLLFWSSGVISSIIGGVIFPFVKTHKN